MSFASESVYLMADNFCNEVVILHRSQEVPKMLSLCTHSHTGGRDSDLLFEVVLQKYFQFLHKNFILVTVQFSG
jgi:hypothetical protein